MSRIKDLADPDKAAILTMEVQRGVVGDLAAIPLLAEVLVAQGMPKRLGGLVERARAVGVPIVHCRAAFRRDRKGSFKNVPMVNHLLKNPDHIVLGSPEADVIPELGPEESDLDSVRLHGMSPLLRNEPRSDAAQPRRLDRHCDGRLPERPASRGLRSRRSIAATTS